MAEERKDECINAEKEYERIASEILQNQKIRITLFTFSVTTSAAIVGLSLQKGIWGVVVLAAAAVYTILIPSVILVYHYTRSINCLSEYLNIAHNEQWMKSFDKLIEVTIPKSDEVTKSHRVLVKAGAYSTGKAFSVAYFLLNLLILILGLSKTKADQVQNVWIFVSLFVAMLVVMWLFRPISKRKYLELWETTLKS
jgi:hypothetical protein